MAFFSCSWCEVVEESALEHVAYRGHLSVYRAKVDAAEGSFAFLHHGKYVQYLILSRH